MKFIKKNVKRIIRFLLIPFVLKDYLEFKKKDLEPRFKYGIKNFYPCIKDKTIKTNFDSHYIYHTAWAARKVKEIHPIRHTDISSSLYFCGIVSAFIPVDFYDYRQADLKLNNLTSRRANLTKLSFPNNSINSLSCLHTVEHIGLGRYGDEINPDGDLQAMAELKRVLVNNGNFLFVVPVGQPKIEFDAHRIYSYEQILGYFKDLTLKEFSLITDDGNFIENARPELVKDQNYGCGCFWFIKK